jgi:hypothetical protein
MGGTSDSYSLRLLLGAACRLNQQARGRSDAVTARQSYIPYSAIPEIAAQAAAEAEAASSQAANNNAEPGAVPPVGAAAAAAADGSGSSSDASDGSSNGKQQQQQLRLEAPPATPRRSRSAPNLADLHGIDEAEQYEDELQEEAAVDADADAAANVQEQCGTSTVAGAAAPYCCIAPGSSSSKFHQQLQPAVSAFLSFVGRGPASSSLPGIHTDDRFFYWLDEGSGRHVDLADRGVARSKLESERVQYLTESERDQLEVTVDRSSGRLVYVVSGQTVHTGSELSLVQMRPPEQQQQQVAAAAAAAVAVDSSGPCAASRCNELLMQDRGLQRIPEVPAEEEEEEEEEDEQQDEDEEPGSTQKQQRQLQRQQLQQMQQTIRQPQHQQQQQPGLQIQRVSDLCHDAAAAADQQQQADADVIMQDAEPVISAAPTERQQQLFCTPSKPAAASSAGAVASADTATPSAAAYGSVAGQATPGTTGISQRRRAPLMPAENQQQQQPVLQPQANGLAQQQQQHAAGLLKIKEKPCKWIYVLDTAKRLFVHAKYRGKFHHSSFLQGGAVLSAGGIVVERGRIMKLTADSGHYRPNFESFMFTVQLLKDMGADLTQTKLSAKHIKCPPLPETGP